MKTSSISKIKNKVKPAVSAVSDDTSWEEEYAYTLGVQAYIWGFPWIYLDWIRWVWTSGAGQTLASFQGQTLPQMPMNTINHAELASPKNKTGGSPNCDVLYSLAWLDLSEPLVLCVPEVADRYYTMELFCIDADNFAYVGTRTTGTKAGNYLLAGPGWSGEVPEGVQDILPRSRTKIAGIIGRTKVLNIQDALANEKDLAEATAIQQKYKLCPLEDWPSIPENKRDFSVYKGYRWPKNPITETNNAFERMNWAMTQNPPGLAPGIDQSDLIKLFATIGVGPNQDVSKQSDATQKGLARAAETGIQMLKNILKYPKDLVNGWSYPVRHTGMAGQNRDYITRASLQALGGIVANDCMEAVYLNTAVDSDGNRITSDGIYIIHFEKDGYPPINSFAKGYWSITMYENPGYNLAGSGNFNVNMDYDKAKDGSMTILIQLEKPKDMPQGTYWLQPPPSTNSDGEKTSCYLIIRVYGPGPEVGYSQSWVPPTIKKV